MEYVQSFFSICTLVIKVIYFQLESLVIINFGNCDVIMIVSLTCSHLLIVLWIIILHTQEHACYKQCAFKNDPSALASLYIIL